MQLIPALFQKEICWYSTFSRTMLCLTFALSGQPCPEKSALSGQPCPEKSALSGQPCPEKSALSGQPCPEKSALPRLRQPLFLYLEGCNQTKM